MRGRYEQRTFGEMKYQMRVRRFQIAMKNASLICVCYNSPAVRRDLQVESVEASSGQQMKERRLVARVKRRSLKRGLAIMLRGPPKD